MKKFATCVCFLFVVTMQLFAQSNSSEYTLKWFDDEKVAVAGMKALPMEGDKKFYLQDNRAALKYGFNYSLVRLSNDDVKEAEANLNFSEDKMDFVITDVFTVANRLYRCLISFY